jgi:hypothetical protein
MEMYELHDKEFKIVLRQLSELQENTNGKLNEIRKIVMNKIKVQ